MKIIISKNIFNILKMSQEEQNQINHLYQTKDRLVQLIKNEQNEMQNGNGSIFLIDELSTILKKIDEKIIDIYKNQSIH